MTSLVNSQIDDLRNLHEQASIAANSAFEYALKAGLMLIAVKNELPHGQFLPWIQSLGFIDIRMAQRYMAVASGKKLTIGGRESKYDTVSYLKNAADECSSGKLVPLSGHWHWCSTDDATFWVVPWDKNDKFFHISKFYRTGEISTDEEDMFEEISFYVGTNSPIPDTLVDGRLKFYGLSEPLNQQWNKKKKVGTERPFGEPEDYMKRMMELAESQGL